MKAQMISLEKLLRVPIVEPETGFDISPDGGRIAFASNPLGHFEIYELDLNTENATPRQMSDGQGAKFAPQYSPDGASLAWALDLDGGESFHIVVKNLHSGTTLDLDPHAKFAMQPTFAWSPDGKRIAYLSDKKNNFDLYTRNADGADDTFTFSAGGPAYSVKYSPDGAYLAMTACMEIQNNGVFLIALKDGSAQRIGAGDSEGAAFSPDSKKIAFVSNESGWQQVGVYDIETQNIVWLTSGASNHYQPFWSPDGGCLGWVNAQGARTRIEVSNEAGAVQTLGFGDGLVHNPTFSADGRSVIAAFESPHHPADLWRATLDDGHVSPLTNSLPAELRDEEFVMPIEITYPAQDGTLVPALLYKSADADEHTPAAVFIHGGPSWHLSFLWYPILSHMASRGWTIICPNYRGSTGYGRAWQTSNRFEIGRIDNDDCVAAAEYLVGQKIADRARIAVTGRSHGGYLTMTALTRNPEVFAVGAAIVPFINWFTGHKNSREDLQHWDIENMGKPEENEALWRERSPFFFLDKIRVPVQLIAAENDPRCPPQESVAAYEKLRALGLDAELWLYENEGHAFINVDNMVDAETKRVNFIARILERKTEMETAA